MLKRALIRRKLHDLQAIATNDGIAEVSNALNSTDIRYLPYLRYRTGKQLIISRIGHAVKLLQDAQDAIRQPNLVQSKDAGSCLDDADGLIQSLHKDIQPHAVYSLPIQEHELKSLGLSDDEFLADVKADLSTGTHR